MSQEIQQLRKSIFDELTKIVDPEIGSFHHGTRTYR